jgi:germination protein M
MQLRFKRGGLLFLFLSLMLTISGCGFLGEKTSEKIDPPVNEENYVEEGESLDGDSTGEATGEEDNTDQAANTTQRVIYLIDKNGYVVPQTFNLPVVSGVANQALEYMVKDGPITNMLPDDMQAVLPAGTVINGVDIKEGTAVVDFSEEFKEYTAESEQKILQAITFTLTQFDTVNNVKLRVAGKDLATMPVNGTPIGDGVSRANGINLDEGSVVDIQNSETVTLYFLANHGDNNYYYVPVTRRISETDDLISKTIEELVKGPAYDSNLVSDFSGDVELLSKPVIKDDVVTLNFNKNLLGDIGGLAISNEVLNAIVLSITENREIKQVAIQVDGKSEFLNAEGEEFTAPVTRPESVNTIGF